MTGITTSVEKSPLLRMARALARSPLKGRPGGGRGRLVSTLVIGVLAVGAAPAAAEEQPAILKSYGLDWIERVREGAWPQPKEKRPVICLLDTGVAVTPDTPESRPDGPIVARLSIEVPPDDGANLRDDATVGGPQGDSVKHFHGTRMAAVIAAPRNGSGTVGVFPQARIVSVRVTVGGAVFITPPDLVAGVKLCRRWVDAAGVAIAAVVMAESNYSQRAEDVPLWETAAASTLLSGGVFVSAAGNRPEDKTVVPFAAINAISIGAGGVDGLRCAFAALEQTGDLLGPGCDSTDAGWSTGSSAATAATGALLAAFATRQPETSPADRVSFVMRAATVNAEGARKLDGTPVAERFSGFVSEPTVAPSPGPPGLSIGSERAAGVGDVNAAATPVTVLFRPKVSAVWRRGRLSVRRLDRHRSGVLCAIVSRRGDRVADQCASGKNLVVEVRRKPQSVLTWVEGEAPVRWRSLASKARVARR